MTGDVVDCVCPTDMQGTWHRRGCIFGGIREYTRAAQNTVTVATRPTYGLSRRETEVARLMVTGLPNKAIAVALVISRATVKTHVRAIFEKTQTANRTQAAFKLGGMLTLA